MNDSEQEAVSSLRQCVQELRSSLASNEGDKEQLTNQLDESKRIYNELSEAYEEKVSCIHFTIHYTFFCTRNKHIRNMRLKSGKS